MYNGPNINENSRRMSPRQKGETFEALYNEGYIKNRKYIES